MLADERKSLILEYINSNQAVSTTELMTQFDASEATIRRDLTELNQKGLITKVHGGAVSLQNQVVSDYNISDRETLNSEEKLRIGRYAASLIKSGDLVYIDAGTTTSYIIDFINIPDVTFVTNAVTHAQRLAARGYKVYLTGGILKTTTEAIVGIDCCNYISQFHFPIGFFGTNAINRKHGLTTPDPDEARVKECALGHTHNAYILCDHSKFDLTSSVAFGSFDKGTIITGEQPADQYKDAKNIVIV